MGKRKTSATAITIQAAAKPDGEAWLPTAIDQASLSQMLRGTWIFAHEPDVQGMQQSLAQTLNYYPHLCGRMHDPKTARLTNDGVPFVVQQMKDVSVQDASDDHGLANRVSQPLHAGRIKKGRMAPMAVTLTTLKDGFVLAVRASHGFVDGMAFYTLVDTWSRIHRNVSFQQPLLDQTVFPAPRRRKKADVIAEADDFNWSPYGASAMVTARRHMAKGTFKQRCLATSFANASIDGAQRQLRETLGLNISRHELLSAHMMRLWGKLFDYPDGTELYLVSVLDAREHLTGVPACFVGNATWSPVSATVLSGDTVASMAQTIHHGLSRYREKPSGRLNREIQLASDLAHHNVVRLPYDFVETLRKDPRLVYINNYCHAPIYSPNFGGGTPVCVIPHDLPDPILIWPQPPAKDGVDVYFNGIAAKQYGHLAKAHPFFSELQLQNL